LKDVMQLTLSTELLNNDMIWSVTWCNTGSYDPW